MGDWDKIELSGPVEVYSDSLRMGVSPYGLMFEFGLQATTGDPGDTKTQAIVRMSPQHAFVMCQILRNNLREYQNQVGKITLPAALLAELGIEEEL